MRLALGLLMFLLSVYLGYLKTLPIKKRKDFFISFNNFNLIFKNSVFFEKKTIFQIMNANKNKDDFNELLNEYINTGSSNIDKNYLTNAEKVFIKEYLEVIGKGDERSQIDYVNHVYEMIEDKKKQCYEDEKKFGSMYFKLSILIGLMLFIVVV